ncbi:MULTISPECIES: OsmC family protein [unclassified Caballeronia]|uniref:OsmC family protein n=1 Tax=unclassified Caballeronia TaxID=2646786 RepID=UPI00285EC98D|nr:MULTISPECIES: OsmC family protein [unclassified Caballeronia]MDR5737006.1 OsmC family protein [Caballeronia sp. LZ016]MDR5810464.1 OsmC family protein [Caballeronia sp. LZ019]
MSKQHTYELTIAWTGNRGSGTSAYDAYSRDHVVRVANKAAIEASSDPAFRGDAARHNPEELFVASLSSCHMLWYLHLCAVNKIVVTGYVDDAVGIMQEDANRSGRFADVMLRPRVTIGAGGDTALAARLHEEAHRFCFIANSVNFPVRCEPSIDVSTA